MNIKVIQRLLLGLLASLLLAAGFARAADRLDPMSISLSVVQKDDPPPPGPPCDDGGDGDR